MGQHRRRRANAVAARREADKVLITVGDSGPGIPRADQDRMFGPFERGGAPDPGGAGLGLTLVKRFVELHGGRVELASVPGKGTTVTCVLPATEAGAAD